MNMSEDPTRRPKHHTEKTRQNERKRLDRKRNHTDRTSQVDLTTDHGCQRTRQEDQDITLSRLDKPEKKTRQGEMSARGLHRKTRQQTRETWDSDGLDSPPPACNGFCWGGLCPSWCRLRNSPPWHRSPLSGSGGCSSAVPLPTHLCQTHTHTMHFRPQSSMLCRKA